MARALLPFYFHASHAARAALQERLGRAALVAIRAVLKNRGSLEVACQQVVYGEHCLALSSRISASGDLVIEIDIGDPRLGDCLILEDELRKAERKARETETNEREAMRKLNRRRW